MLRLSNTETDRLTKLGQVLMQLSALPRPLIAKEIRKIAFRIGRQATTEALVIDAGRRDVKVPTELWMAAGSAPTHSPFTGAALIKRGIPAGPLVGTIIRHAETAWADADFPSDTESLRGLMADAITRYSGSVQTES
jgi:poly(A) polymerase